MSEPRRAGKRSSGVQATSLAALAGGAGARGLPSMSALGAALADMDINALAQVYDHFHPAVHAVAYRVTHNRTSAEDVMQDVFVSLWKNPAAYRPERGSIGTWLMTAAHGKAVEAARREESHRRRRHEVADPAKQQLGETRVYEPVEETASERRRADRVRDALAELPEKQREAVVLAYLGGYTQQEIAEITDAPSGTVRRRMFSAIQKLGDVLPN